MLHKAAAKANFYGFKLIRSINLTKTIKRLDFTLEKTDFTMEETTENHSNQFTFQPGQWVDYFIQEKDLITGYSMISSPLDLPNISLVVQLSKDPAAIHVHTHSEINDIVWLRSGGEVTWEASSAAAGNVLLIAGGIGVTPFASMLNNVVALDEKAVCGNCALIHSSRDNILKEDLTKASKQQPNNIKYISKETNGSGIGRINTSDIEAALHFLDNSAKPILCGNENFIEAMQNLLVNEFQYKKEEIVVEKWW
jgi:ferredoxin-NADP reductase